MTVVPATVAGMIDLSSIANACGKARQTPRGSFICLCPAHGDATPSLQIAERNGKVRLRCYAGCETFRIRQALRKRGVHVTKRGNILE
jgi:hypothetical protein